MAKSTIPFLVAFLFSLPFASSFSSSLSQGSSLSVQNPQDLLISPNGVFSAGFVAVGENAFSFAIWFTEPNFRSPDTVIWTANRDQPVNGKGSKLSLLSDGNMVLEDASLNMAWSSNTASLASPVLHLNGDGNLVLRETQGTRILWQSFDFPTDTLVPGQRLSRQTQLVSSVSQSNHSPGFYKLFFDEENVLTLHYDTPDIASSYWPKPWLLNWDAGRSNYNSSRVAVLDSIGCFSSTDNFTFVTTDYGAVIQRRMKLDSDGNVRVYSRKSVTGKWYVSWQATANGCLVHGVCGANSTCGFDFERGRTCLCLPGYRVRNPNDWSYGCEPKFESFSCKSSEVAFLKMRGVELYGYDNHFYEVRNYSSCESLCSRDCTCRAFQYSYYEKKGVYRCYTKTQLLNGRRSPKFTGNTYLKFPKSSRFVADDEFASDILYDHVCSVEVQRVYTKPHGRRLVQVLLWFASALGALEMFFIFVVWCCLFRTSRRTYNADQYGYHLAATGFRKFSYSELKSATKGFGQEIGRGAQGAVYKGLLADQRQAAIKRLNEAKQGEGEFLAEVSIIGRLNHMNLIEMWGYCAEGKHRLLVYEYMENGSLAENLQSNTLDWSKRYKIALGIARVLAYLHEQCLEWILHCDIKPQNILLDSNFQPKLADFGLSKLLNRNNIKNPSISMIRGTRGYMAPEWVFNLPITSKVDVYSYGIVVLEMVSGKSPTSVKNIYGEETFDGRLVAWAREKRRNPAWVEQIIDPAIGPNYDRREMEILTKVALACVVEDKDSRPTMSQVVEMLQSHGSDP